MGKSFTPAKPQSIKYNRLNPNTAFPLQRETNKIIGQRIVEGTKVCKTNFIFKEIIGKGHYGPIWLVEKLPDREKMVIKIMDKLKIYKTRSVETVMNE